MNLNIKGGIQYEAKWPFSPSVLYNLKKTKFPLEYSVPDPSALTSNRTCSAAVAQSSSEVALMSLQAWE